MAHSPETKAAVMAALLAGQSISQVVQEYQLPETTVKRWRAEGDQNMVPKKEIIGELLIGYLAVNLETLRKQAEFFSDTKWLNRQDASSVAVLHGVMTDKAIRLLEALSKNVPND